jgi:bifunctional non-homologous end joining protein LigD
LDAATVEAMACKLVPSLPDGPEWIYEVKWDGYRAIGQKSAEGLSLFSRQHKDFAGVFRDIHHALADLRCESAVVDGEIVAMVDGKPSFQALQASRSRKPEILFFHFDLLEVNGNDYRRQPLTARRERLDWILPKHSILKLSPALPGDAAALMEGAQSLGFEGIVAKRKDSFYEEGERSGDWQKWKAEQMGTFYIGGYVPGTTGFDELVIGTKEKAGLRFVARLKNGFVPATRANIMDTIRGLTVQDCPLYNLPEPKAARWGQGLTAVEMAKCRWVKPKVKVEVAFVEWTEGEKLRHARFLKLKV